MFDDRIEKSVRRIAARFEVEPAALLAVVEVESGGIAFASVDGRQEPLIRFEGHYFDQRLLGDKRSKARASGLSSPVTGAVKNPKHQIERWRLFERAAEIDREAACESISWGVGQVMGAHWRWLGYGSVAELVAEARSGLEGQISLMMRYIDRAGLLDALRRGDWRAFARGYNGPAYARNGYHRRLEAAYRRYVAEERSSGDQAAARSSRDARDSARTLQRLLTAAGYAVSVDGIAGPATERAIRRFQADRGLSIDGIAGAKTMSALRQATRSHSRHGFRVAVSRWLRRMLGMPETT